MYQLDTHPSRKDKKSPLTAFDEVFMEGAPLPFPFSPTFRPLFSLFPSVDCPPSIRLYLEPPYPPLFWPSPHPLFTAFVPLYSLAYLFPPRPPTYSIPYEGLTHLSPEDFCPFAYRHPLAPAYPTPKAPQHLPC